MNVKEKYGEGTLLCGSGYELLLKISSLVFYFDHPKEQILFRHHGNKTKVPSFLLRF